MSAVAVAAFFTLVAIPRSAIPLIDGDVWWHIRAGQTVLSTGRVPNVDTWSIVGHGLPWTSQDWLSNVFLALGDRLGVVGWLLLSAAFALLVALALALLWKGIRRVDNEAGWLGRLVWLAAGLTVAGPTLGVRVQVVDLPLAAGALYLLWRYRRYGGWGTLIGLPLIAVGWANLHAGWLLLFLLGGAMVVGEAVDRLCGRQLESPPLTWSALGRLVLALAASAAVLVLNPSGVALYAYPLSTAFIPAHREFLAEWSTPDIGTLPGQLLAAFIVVGVLPTLLLTWRRLRLADALVLVGLSLMAVSAARFLLVMGPICAAIVAAYLDPALARTTLGRNIGPVLRRMASAPHSTSTGALNFLLIIAIGLTGAAVTFDRAGPAAQRELVGQNMPVMAVDWILANDPGFRPFNQYSWGGYLGVRRPNDPVYIDGRSDIYGDAPIRRFAETVLLERDPQAVMDADRIDYVLFNVQAPLAKWLDKSAAWRLAYADDLAGVWVRR